MLRISESGVGPRRRDQRWGVPFLGPVAIGLPMAKGPCQVLALIIDKACTAHGANQS